MTTDLTHETPFDAYLAEIVQDATALFEQYEPAANDAQPLDDGYENLYAMPA
jgi:hypothetical protein